MTESGGRQEIVTGREAAARALGRAAEQFPELSPGVLETEGLSAAERRLAVAIYRTAAQRWITLEAVLRPQLRKGLGQLEPKLVGVLLAGAAQLVFMQRLPAYAVVNESVKLARKLVRPGAGGLVNAVLRKVERLVDRFEPGRSWKAEASVLPMEEGVVVLAEPVLSGAGEVVEQLSVATSHPRRLVRRWIDAFGEEATREICLQGLIHPPTILAVEANFDAEVHAEVCHRHEQAGFVVWTGKHEQLGRFLRGHCERRVQDPASTLAVRSAAGLAVKRVLDLCAGRGTKTRQIAMTFPAAQVVATDTDAARLTDLREVGRELASVEVVEADELAGRFDLILLDVPCSNTGVLGRRPEARYRFDEEHLASLVGLQREIIERAAGMLEAGGWLLYSTCSLEAEENQQQRAWIVDLLAGEVIHDALTLPGGAGASHHDGSYHALVRKPKGGRNIAALQQQNR